MARRTHTDRTFAGEAGSQCLAGVLSHARLLESRCHLALGETTAAQNLANAAWDALWVTLMHLRCLPAHLKLLFWIFRDGCCVVGKVDIVLLEVFKGGGGGRGGGSSCGREDADTAWHPRQLLSPALGKCCLGCLEIVCIPEQGIKFVFKQGIKLCYLHKKRRLWAHGGGGGVFCSKIDRGVLTPKSVLLAISV